MHSIKIYANATTIAILPQNSNLSLQFTFRSYVKIIRIYYPVLLSDDNSSSIVRDGQVSFRHYIYSEMIYAAAEYYIVLFKLVSIFSYHGYFATQLIIMGISQPNLLTRV